LYYHIKLVVKPPKPLSTIELESPVRSKAVHMLNIENPLSKNVIMKVVCDCSDIIVPSQLELAPDSQTKLVFEYLPLIVTPTEKKEDKLYKLELSCPELGNYPYMLKLKALATGPEKNLHFSTSLGNSQTQTIRFIHYSRVDTTYTCELNSKNFSFAEKNTIKASAGMYIFLNLVILASKNGDELSLDIVYEPSSLGSCKDTLIIKSPQGGEYLFFLFGYCITPRPQGPIEIQANGSATVNFKNVFNIKKEFLVTVDHADFTIKQNLLSLAPKQKASIVVNYKPSNAMKQTHGKLVISSKDSPTLNWVYYLKGLSKM
jgi:hydrocephalus-inducing protein